MPLPSTAPSGIVESVFHRLVSRRATVREVEPLGEEYRLVSLVSADLVDRRWRPGDMVQLGFSGFEGRAYTPLSFSPPTGALTLLGYVHGHGVASSWLASATVGEQVFFVGPRSSGLNLEAIPRPLIFFGDETSVGTAAALLETSEAMRSVTLCFEVNDKARSEAALERFALSDDLTLVTREPEDRHLERVEKQIVDVLRAAPNTRCVFTGSASSIQRMYKAVRRAGLPAKHVTNVAYWAPGRKGFSGVQR